jgi:hypothetical protein
MTALGARKYNATGRTIGARKTNARTRIQGQFAPRLIDMLRSPAYRTLSLSEHRILARLEIELADHGGKDNGRLPCTFDDFERYGLRRKSIAAALRTLEALGFIKITEAGRGGNGEWRRPNCFQLTYRNVHDLGPTDDWQKIASIEQAEAVASAARASPKNRNARGGNATNTRGGNATAKLDSQGRKRPYCPGAETPPLSISREDAPWREWLELTPEQRRGAARPERLASERHLAEAEAAAMPTRDAYLALWCWVVVLRSSA